MEITRYYLILKKICSTVVIMHDIEATNSTIEWFLMVSEKRECEDLQIVNIKHCLKADNFNDIAILWIAFFKFIIQFSIFE